MIGDGDNGCLELHGIDKKADHIMDIRSLLQIFNVFSFLYSFLCCIAQQKACAGLKVDESRSIKLLISERTALPYLWDYLLSIFVHWMSVETVGASHSGNGPPPDE
ncbi:hypothetical protein Tco_1365002, partial [Tanacetum coccineum]